LGERGEPTKKKKWVNEYGKRQEGVKKDRPRR